jgi:hypothetical protein
MNFRRNEGSRFPYVRSLWAGIVLVDIVLLTPVVGCALIGVEPEEIDLAGASESEGVGEEASDETGEQGATEGGSDTEDDGGDGDGDAADETGCAELGALPLELGSNDVMIDPGESLVEGSCGHPGPEGFYSYVGDEAVNLEFTLNGFDAALYAVDGLVCLPLVESSCVNTPAVLMVTVEAGQIVHVVVDAATADGGSGTLDVAIMP